MTVVCPICANYRTEEVNFLKRRCPKCDFTWDRWAYPRKIEEAVQKHIKSRIRG